MTNLFLIFFSLLTAGFGCIDDFDKKAKSSNKEVVVSPQTPPLVFRIPPDAKGVGGFKTVNLLVGKGKKRKKVEEIFPDTSDVQISISTKSGYEFSTFLRKQEVVLNDSFPACDSLIAISDIEGNFDAFTAMLRSAGIVDTNFNWTFGDKRLVLPGDFFDRGDEVFEVLWLVYKLEQEAEAAGGGVHFVLGNHEWMNLNGDDRYVHAKYTVFADALKIPYADWLAKGSVLGDWLRTKNCVEKIGENLFVHAGLSPALVDSSWTIREINDINRLAMNSSLDALRQKCQFVTGTTGPLWYRDMSLQKLKQTKVNEILASFDAERVIVGHTIVDGEHISSLYEGRVINIDLHHMTNYGKGIVRSLLITPEGVFEIDNQGGKREL